jgi:mannose-6-phosphate isomerase-like protein (cupin superfamily)
MVSIKHFITAVALGGLVTTAAWTQDDPVRDQLADFAADYAQDPYVTEAHTFGIRIDDRWFTVTAAPGDVQLTDGMPAEPTYYFFGNAAAVEAVHNGQWSGLTSMVKEFSSDEAPLDMDVMEGFQPDATFLEDLLGTAFHFWNRGQPEVIPFGRDHTRVSHGANTGVFYYQPGFRSGFFNVRPGQHVNENPVSQTNPFPSLFIVTEGWAHARINGRDLIIEEGNAYFVPAGQEHQFWLPDDAEHEMFGFLFMFGEGA